eukprot:1406667-Pleurochrysis_carterae.AAC.1
MCHHNLWAREPHKAVEALRKQRTKFLALSDRDRRKKLLDVLQFEAISPAHASGEDGNAQPPANVIFLVGETAGTQRR